MRAVSNPRKNFNEFIFKQRHFYKLQKQIFSSGKANIFLQLKGPANCFILEALDRAYQSTLKVDIDKRLRLISKLRLIKFELAFGQVVHIITD